MSMQERTGERCLLYSGFHRPYVYVDREDGERVRVPRLERYLSRREAASLTVIDIDWCEACEVCYQPLALIETQRSAHLPKQAPIMAKLAHLAGLPAWSVSYQPTDEGDDIEVFRVRQVEPFDDEAVTMSPDVYAKWLLHLRAAHVCPPRGR
jgi:hypothetical protein